MAYDDIKDPLKGSPKLSEIAVDREGEMTGALIGETALTVIERMNRTQSDALKRMGSVLYSEGDICWTLVGGNPTIISPDKSLTPLPPMDHDGADMQLRFTQTSDIADFDAHQDPADQTLISVSRTIDLIITAAQINANAALFSLEESEILYIAITYDDINGSAGVGSPINVLGNLQKVTPAGDLVGMPSLENKLDGNETTLFIPLAMRVPDWNNGVDPVDKQDLLWLVNGTTRWPIGTCSPLGSLITDLNKSLPSTFVTTEGEFDAALVTYGFGTGGGIICIDQPITLTGVKNVDEDIHIFGRSSSLDGGNSSLLTFGVGASLHMGDRTRLWNLGMADALINPVVVQGDGVLIEKCRIDSPNGVSLIYVEGSNARIRDCVLSGAAASGIFWRSGTNNTAKDIIDNGLASAETYFNQPLDEDNLGSYTEAEVYRALQAIPPIGSIIPILQGYYADAINTNFVDLSGATTVSDNWYPCNGDEVSDVNSPIWTVGPATHVPNLTGNRFLMGTDNSFGFFWGSIGGANTHNHIAAGAIADFNDITTETADIEHTHEFEHTHAWAGTADSTSGDMLLDLAWYTYDSAAGVDLGGGTIPDGADVPFASVDGDPLGHGFHGLASFAGFGDIEAGTGIPAAAGAMFTSHPYIDAAGDTLESTTLGMNTATIHDHTITGVALDAGQNTHDHVISFTSNIPQYLAVRYFIRIK